MKHLQTDLGMITIPWLIKCRYRNNMIGQLQNVYTKRISKEYNEQITQNSYSKSQTQKVTEHSP